MTITEREWQEIEHKAKKVAHDTFVELYRAAEGMEPFEES